MIRALFRRYRDLLFIAMGAVVFAGGPSAIATLYSANHWYDIRSVKVANGLNFEELTVIVDRSIYKDFNGDFNVTVWPIDLSGPVCHGGDKGIPYKATSTEVISRTAEWLMGTPVPPECQKVLKAGERYIANVTVTIHPEQAFLWWMPPPTDSVWTNIFTITED